MTVWPRGLRLAMGGAKAGRGKSVGSPDGRAEHDELEAATNSSLAPGSARAAQWPVVESECAKGAWRAGGQLCEGMSRSRLGFVLVLLTVGGISIATFVCYALYSAETRAWAVFEGEAKIVANSVQLALGDVVSAAEVIKTYMDATEDATHDGFRVFAERLLKSTRTQSFQFVPEVRGAREREELEEKSAQYWRERLQVSNSTEFPIRDVVDMVDPATGEVVTDPETGRVRRTLVEAAEADVYFPIQYFEPTEGNEALINFNLISIAEFVEAGFLESIESGESISFGPLSGETDEDGAYSTSLIVQVPLETRRAIVLNTIRVPDMMSRVLAELPTGRELYIFGDGINGPELLFGGFAGAPLKPVPAATIDELRMRRLFFHRSFQELRRNWTVVACSNEYYISAGSGAVVAPAIMLGLLFLGLSALSILIMRRESQHSRRKADLVATQAQNEAKAVTRAERNLNDFLAHEVRNPLSVAIAAQRFLLMSLQEATWVDNAASSAATRDVELIGASLTFILELVNNMLDLNKCLEQQTVVLNPTTVSLKDDVLGPVKSMLGRDISGISIQMEVEEGDNWVLADGLRLKQVVMNLAKNAIKFVETGFVRLSAHRVSSERVIIAVEDSGPGVPEHKREAMFAKYQESLDKMQQGTGIGLCLSKLIVDSMHGDLYLDTDYNSGVEGCPGARFVIDVPLEAVAPPDSSPGSIPEPDAHELATRCFLDKAILVVDDDPVVRAVLVRRLNLLFPSVAIKVASSAEVAFELLAEHGMHNFAVIFVDHYMPGPGSPMTGVEAIQRLRAEGFDGLIFGCSANDVRRQHLKAGADDFFQKPLPADAVVSRAIQRCSALRSLRSVLIVDDQKVNLLVLRRMLSGVLPSSVEIESDTSGEAAIARDKSFDVVILDEHMGTGLLGSQVAARMRERGRESLLISLSGGLGEAQVAGQQLAVFDALWEKPLPPPDVLRDRLLELLLKKAAPQQALEASPGSPVLPGEDGDSSSSDLLVSVRPE